MEWVVAPDNDGRGLPNVLPSLLAAMGMPGFEDTLGFPACRNAAVLLVDGLGWNLLHEYAEEAPLLAELATRNPLTAGFPTTTVTSITSLGTGRYAGEHGVVGYTFAEPAGGLLHPLSWGNHAVNPGGQRRSLLQDWPPEEVQAGSTVLQRAVDGGVTARIAVPAEFRGTGLTRAALRGGDFRALRALGDLAAELLDALGEPGPLLCYGYHGHLDLLGHMYGPGSLPWRLQLAQVDRLVAMLAERLPSPTVLAVVADHGMVAADPVSALDADAEPALWEGVRLLGGEVRARYIYTEPGAEAEVSSAWREMIGQRGLVVTAEQAIDEGWFGPLMSERVRPRIGDVLAVMRSAGVIRSAAEPGESALRGQHGSLTADEQYVPLLVVEN